VLSALLFGMIASSALVIGGLVGAYLRPPVRLVAVALGGAVSMRDQGRTRGFAIAVWTVTAVILAAAVVVGNAVLSGASEKLLSVLLSFAGGAVLASLADTLMPAAYREGGKSVAFATATGFFVSFVISEL
jgi:zinc transporter, ZIP family